MALGAWLRENASCYLGNAAAMRDYRVQLRGNRATMLWGFYLLVLIGFALLVYTGTASGERTNIVYAQSALRGFYQSIMFLLAFMVNAIAPALTAGSIVMERQRRSLDLVFSSPVKPKYYLVGKMISSYRYTWMLLILSLPVTSACVVLGGATWSDVVAAYIVLSLNALIYTSMALLLSTLARQPVAAVIWSYVASITYSIASAFFVGSNMAFSGMMSSQEMPFVVTLNPFFVVQAAPTYTTIGVYHVPNWVLGSVVALLFSKLMLLGAASALSGYGAPETKSLRIHGLLYTGLFFALFGFANATTLVRVRAMTSAPGTTSGSSLTTGWDSGINLAFGWMLMGLLALVPFMTCYGKDSERKFWPDGWFSLRGMFLGTPSGGLPYLLGIILSAWLGLWWVGQRAGIPAPGPEMLFWVLALWSFFWSLGRLSSSFNIGLRSARALHFTFLMGLVALPVPFLGAVSSFDSESGKIWDIYVLRPLLGNGDNSVYAWTMGTIMAVAALLATAVAELIATQKGVVKTRGTA